MMYAGAKSYIFDKFYKKTIETDMTTISELEMGFFRDLIFNFGLDRKIPKFRGSGSGFENSGRIPRKSTISPFKH